jgi:SHS2 domain-containing protein
MKQQIDEPNQQSPDAHFTIVEHTADWALNIRGRDLGQLLSHAAEGMAHLLVGDLSAVPLEETRQLAVTAYDAESLLVEWLSELAYWAEQLVFVQFDFHDLQPAELDSQQASLRAEVRGGRVSEMQKHIKAVTYHDLAITQTDDGLEVTVVFDV